jgi:YD repeat-containing protein
MSWGGGLTYFGGAGGITCNGLGDGLTGPTTVTGNARLMVPTGYGYDAQGRLVSEMSAGTAWSRLNHEVHFVRRIIGISGRQAAKMLATPSVHGTLRVDRYKRV